jgi:Cdc6-like AAA superfamily ATPase
MDLRELMKLNMFSQGASNADSNWMHLAYQLVVFVVMSVIDDVIKALPGVVTQTKNAVLGYCTSRVKDTVIDAVSTKTLLDSSVPLKTRHQVNTLFMTRVYVAESDKDVCEESNAVVDAVLNHISKLQNVPTFQLIDKARFMITYKDKPVQITPDIFAKITGTNFTSTGKLQTIRLSLQSNTLSATEMTSYTLELHRNYMQELKNSLGNQIFFFDHKHKDTQPPQAPHSGASGDELLNYKVMRINTAPKTLNFTMTPFVSNKQFSNIFGAEIREIEQRVRFFLENRAWYDAKGIPYQLGILLSGKPGTGKTSCIRAIANITRRHIVNVNFANVTTATQLKALFYNDKLQVYNDNSMANTVAYHIPVPQRLYVLEEIDAIGDVVKQRTSDAPVEKTVADELTLMEILTVMDGTIETPGRILIMTSNHPETLDAALIRPGRIDVHVTFDYAPRDLLAEMYNSYLGSDVPSQLFDRLPDRQLSPAEAGQVLFRHFNKGSDAAVIVNDLIDTAIAKRRPSHIVAQVHNSSSHQVVSDIASTSNACAPTETCDVVKPTTPTADEEDIPSAAAATMSTTKTSKKQDIVSGLDADMRKQIEKAKTDAMQQARQRHINLSKTYPGFADTHKDNQIDKFPMFQTGFGTVDPAASSFATITA